MAMKKGRRRRKRWWKPVLAALERGSSNVEAAQKAGISAVTVYTEKAASPEFKQLCEQAEAAYLDFLQASIGTVVSSQIPNIAKDFLLANDEPDIVRRTTAREKSLRALMAWSDRVERRRDKLDVDRVPSEHIQLQRHNAAGNIVLDGLDYDVYDDGEDDGQEVIDGRPDGRAGPST